MNRSSRGHRLAILTLRVATGHFVATVGALLFAIAFAGDIDAPRSRAASFASIVSFNTFQFLAQPLDRFWVDTASSPARVYGWLALNSALWASASIVVVGGLRAMRRRSTLSRPAAREMPDPGPYPPSGN